MPDERIYVINLSRLYWVGRSRRAPKALRKIKDFLKRHTKAEKIIIDSSINEYIFSRAYDKPPRKIAVRVLPVDKEGKILKAVLAIPVTSSASGEAGTSEVES